VRGEIGVGVSGRGGGSIGEIPVFERGENKRQDNGWRAEGPTGVSHVRYDTWLRLHDH
jgi:hypothetical protein